MGFFDCRNKGRHIYGSGTNGGKSLEMFLIPRTLEYILGRRGRQRSNLRMSSCLHSGGEYVDNIRRRSMC